MLSNFISDRCRIFPQNEFTAAAEMQLRWTAETLQRDTQGFVCSPCTDKSEQTAFQDKHHD